MIQPISPTPRVMARMPSMEPVYNLHKAEIRLIDEIRKRRNCTVIVAAQDGVPTAITPINTDAKMKLA
jgi:hypothetical protein